MKSPQTRLSKPGTGEPVNRGVRLRELIPEQRGMHYPLSTTAERLDSILHPLPVMRLAAKRFCLKYTHTLLCRLALCEINASRGASNKFCISAAASIHEGSANQNDRRKLRGRDKLF
ncbi:hypothetical protein NQZ68_003985 [Dissostichus eleginoides]|nr:hypothetical protein NQZ68_003985 [Dissostichus eleginoides]